MLIECAVSSDLMNSDPLNMTDEPYDHIIVTIDKKNAASKISETRYGMGYESRVKNAKQRVDSDRIDNAQNVERPFRHDRPERIFRPERFNRPERTNRPGR